MRQGPLIVFGTAAVFAAGFGARVWTEGVRPAVNPLPVAISEAAPKEAAPQVRRMPGPNRTRLIETINTLNEQIEQFRGEMDKLESEFTTSFVSLLNDKQKELWSTRNNRGGNRGGGGRGGDGRGGPGREGGERGAEPAAPLPMSDEEIQWRQREGLSVLVRMVAVDDRLANFTNTYSLDLVQQAKVKDLLQARRSKFIALAEGLNPMSIQLSALARDVDRLAGAAPDASRDKPAAPAGPTANPAAGR